jgi:hypothetical protein
MYGLFQAHVPTREGEKYVDVIFDHRPSHEAEDQTKKWQKKKEKTL